jgi:aldose 1-epimerase
VSVTSEPWGALDGEPVELYTLSNDGGVTVSISSYGGSVQSIQVPDRLGRPVNVALGFASLGQYVANVTGADGSPSGATHFGALIGRYANRIAGPSFGLDGRRYELAGNNGPGNSISLHGGPGGGYSGRVWSRVPVAGGGPGATVRLGYVDPDGTNGFPGTVANEVEYSVTGDNALRIEYRASTDAPTVVSPTSHTYFNLAEEGSGDIYDQLLALNAHVVQPVSEVGIPTGFKSVAGTPFDFRTMKPIGRDLRSAGAPAGDQPPLARGYDHNWVLRGSGYRLAAIACDPGSGITLWVYTDRPGVQRYTSNT